MCQAFRTPPAPVVTDPKLASAALKWACTEMDHRYKMLSQWKVRNIANYNAKLEREMEDGPPAKARKYAPADWPENDLRLPSGCPTWSSLSVTC